MLKAYKYRIYPNQEQQELLINIFGQVRFVYNLGLETKINAYIGNKKHICKLLKKHNIKRNLDKNCPHCQSNKIKLNGKNRNKKQIYYCNSCNKNFL